MGVTSKILDIQFLLDSNNHNTAKNLSSPCLHSGDAFNGYAGIHFIKRYGNAEIIMNIDRDELPWTYDFSFGLDGPYNCFIQVLDDFGCPGDDTEHAVMCVPVGKNVPFPVALINADVLPCYAPGTIIFGQAACHATQIEFATTPDELFADLDARNREIVSQLEGLIYIDQDGKGGMRCGVWGKVIGSGAYKVDCKIDGELDHPGIPFVDINTSAGPARISFPYGKILDDEKGFLDKINSDECYVRAHFIMSLDVAVGEYQHGAIFDESHLLRVVADATCNGRFERLNKCFDADIVIKGKRETVGKAIALDTLKKIYENQRNANIQFKWVLLEANEDVPDHLRKDPNRKQGLRLFIRNAKGNIFFSDVFIELNEDGLITRLTYDYDWDPSFKEIQIDDIPSYGISSVESFNIVKPKEECNKMLDSLIRGDLSQCATFYACLSEDAEFDKHGEIYKGRSNAYYWFRDFLENININPEYIMTTEGGTGVRDESFLYMFYLMFNDEGKIETIRVTYALVKDK